MALSDDDKKFITDAIKQSQTNIAKQSSNAQKKAQDEQKQYITTLQKKQEQGTLTLAQSVELLKHDLNETIEQNKVLQAGQEAIHRTVKAGKDLAQGGITSLQGAGQMTSGLATLLLKSNPLTGMFVKNQSSIGALSNVGDGFNNIFKGITKGIFNSASSLLGIKKENKAKTEEQKLPNVAVNKLVAKEIISEKSRTKNLPVEDNSSPTMKVIKQGFAGLRKGFDTANELAKEHGKRSKMILLGLLGGVAAILGLKYFVENTKWGQMIKGAIQEAIPNIVKAVRQKTGDFLEKAGDAGLDFIKKPINRDINNLAKSDLSNLNSNSIMQKFDATTKNNTTKIGKVINSPNNFFNDIKVKELKERGLIDNATEKLMMDPKNFLINFNTSVKFVQNKEDGKRLQFPVPVHIQDSELNKDGTQAVLLKRVPDEILDNMKNANKDWLKEKLKGAPKLIITRVLNILVPKKKNIPRNVPIVTVAANYQIIGDLSEFMRNMNFEEYQNNEKTHELGAKNYKNFMAKEGMSEAYADSEKNSRLKHEVKAGAVETVREGWHNVTDAIKGEDSYDEDYNPAEQYSSKPNKSFTYIEQPGDKQEKISNQSSKLNKQPEPEIPKQIIEEPKGSDDKPITGEIPDLPDYEKLSYGNLLDVQSYNNARSQNVNLQAIV